VKEFAYTRAATVADAVAAVNETPGARYLAGGTNLVDLMKARVEQPTRLVDLQGLPLDRIEVADDGGLRIGAMVSNSDLAAHPEVRRRYPALTKAVLAGASGQLRNTATVGGNLLQRTRCGYFADTTKPCNKRNPGSGCPAIAGEHHNMAILGASSSCVATNPSDMAVALTAFDAVVSLETMDGPATTALSEFYLPVRDTPERETALPPGALITAVTVPAAPVAVRSTYRKVRERASYAFANGSVAAALVVRNGRVHDVRLAFGAVASRPWRATRAEEMLLGAPATTEVFGAAADAELLDAAPLPHNEYKVALMRNLTVAVLLELAESSR
jgi:xanthine dehydrogenase YagS FAD-binding subunit